MLNIICQTISKLVIQARDLKFLRSLRLIGSDYNKNTHGKYEQHMINMGLISVPIQNKWHIVLCVNFFPL